MDPSLSRAMSLTTDPTAAAALVLNAVSATPVELIRLRPPVNDPPTRILPSDCTAIALTVAPTEEAALVLNVASAAPVEDAFFSPPAKLPPTRMLSDV